MVPSINTSPAELNIQTMLAEMRARDNTREKHVTHIPRKRALLYDLLEKSRTEALDFLWSEPALFSEELAALFGQFKNDFWITENLLYIAIDSMDPSEIFEAAVAAESELAVCQLEALENMDLEEVRKRTDIHRFRCSVLTQLLYDASPSE